MIIKLRYRNVNKLEFYFFNLRTLIKNRINIYVKLNTLNTSKITIQHVTIPKGPFAHKKKKEQFALSYRTLTLKVNIPEEYVYYYLTKLALLHLISTLSLPSRTNIEQLTLTFDYLK